MANKQAWKDPVKRQKIEDQAVLLQGAIDGKSKLGVKMNVPRASLDQVQKSLPSFLSPTISTLVDDRYVALEVVLDEKAAREVVTSCKRLGATGIVTYPLNIIIP